MLGALDHWLASAGAWGLAALYLSSAIEYVFPPYPGDTLTLLGGVYAIRGRMPWLLVLAATTLGSVTGGLLAMGLGRLIGRAAERLTDRRSFFGLTPALLADYERRFRERGTWLLLANRFLPGV